MRFLRITIKVVAWLIYGIGFLVAVVGAVPGMAAMSLGRLLLEGKSRIYLNLGTSPPDSQSQEGA